jgi:transposase InsO family protein
MEYPPMRVARSADLPRWLRHYNQERPHASLARQSPTA